MKLHGATKWLSDDRAGGAPEVPRRGGAPHIIRVAEPIHGARLALDAETRRPAEEALVLRPQLVERDREVSFDEIDRELRGRRWIPILSSAALLAAPEGGASSFAVDVAAGPRNTRYRLGRYSLPGQAHLLLGALHKVSVLPPSSWSVFT